MYSINKFSKNTPISKNIPTSENNLAKKMVGMEKQSTFHFDRKSHVLQNFGVL